MDDRLIDRREREKDESDSDIPFTNPSPPPEIVQNIQEEIISNTLFSKHRLFSILLKLIKVILVMS